MDYSTEVPFTFQTQFPKFLPWPYGLPVAPIAHGLLGERLYRPLTLIAGVSDAPSRCPNMACGSSQDTAPRGQLHTKTGAAAAARRSQPQRSRPRGVCGSSGSNPGPVERLCMVRTYEAYGNHRFSTSIAKLTQMIDEKVQSTKYSGRC